MNARIGSVSCALALVAALAFCGCASGASSSAAGSSAGAASASTVASSSAAQAATGASDLAPGVYTAQVKTDSSMFHVNEAMDGTGELTVSDEGMSVHIVLNSMRITNLYVGTAEQAKADPDGVIQPSIDKVTYRDGAEEDVYGFDVPVPALDEEFAVAILGEKGNWYDHTVTVSNPVQQ